jgi:hypothetical protein
MMVALFAVPVMALAQGRPPAANARPGTSVVFRAPDRPAMRNYFRAHSIFATRLPARISKNVMRGNPLPRGVEEGAVPPGLVELLPSRPGVTYLIVGSDVVAMREGIVIDVVFNVFR